MKIVVLDRMAMGADLDFSVLSDYGEVEIYDTTVEDEVLARVKECEALLINKVKITKEVMENAPNLKFVCVFATGYDNVDVSYAKERGIAVTNIPSYSTESVTLYTVATVLNLAARLFEYRTVVSSGEYSKGKSPNRIEPVYHEIFGKTWGIIGCGTIGSRVAAVAESLGCNVITHQRHPHAKYKTVALNELLAQSDIITIHCPLTEQTFGLIGREEIKQMKAGVILVNEARGAVCCEEAIAEAMHNGRIAAFGCDVYSKEPFPVEHPFYQIKDNPCVCLTPHAAWAAYEARKRALGIVADNIRSYLEGKSLNRIV